MSELLLPIVGAAVLGGAAAGLLGTLVLGFRMPFLAIFTAHAALAGAILAFSFAMLEVSDSLILAQTQDYYPITKQIYTLAGIADTQNLAAALGMFGMGLLTATLVGANLLLGRRLGALFRV